jgi:Terminase RNaseH-like domain
MSRLCVQATWDDVPHLSEAVKAQLVDGMSPHMRDARTKGVPMLGAGVIYPAPEDGILCDGFEIPDYWPRAYGMDVGWNKTAVVWGAWDRSSDVVYLYSEHYMGQAAPSVHASSIKARGEWIPGAIDPASAGASQADGRQLRQEYQKEGLILFDADNSVEAGLHACYQRLVSGRLKVFRTMRSWSSEFRIYRRDEHGKIVKENDHLMDAMRYLIMSGLRYGRTAPSFEDDSDTRANRRGNTSTGY